MKLLDRYEMLSPMYSDGKTNHINSFASALAQLGVSEEQISLLIDSYLQNKIIPNLLDSHYVLSDWEQEYIQLSNVYSHCINIKGRDVIIKRYLNSLRYGLTSSLNHGLIKLYYAIKDGNDFRIAQAFAYFDLIHTECVLPYVIKEDEYQAFDELLEYRNQEVTLQSISTLEQFEEVYCCDNVKENVFMIPEYDEERILKFFLHYYLKSLDEYTMHVIIGFQALRGLKEYFNDYEEALEQYFVHAIILMLINKYDHPVQGYSEYDLSRFSMDVLGLYEPDQIEFIHALNELYKAYELPQILQAMQSVFEED